MVWIVLKHNYVLVWRSSEDEEKFLWNSIQVSLEIPSFTEFKNLSRGLNLSRGSNFDGST